MDDNSLAMKSILVSIFAAVLLVGCGRSQELPSQAKAKDNKPIELEGKWQIVHCGISGSKQSGALGIVDEIVGNKWIRPKRRTSVYILKLNPQSIPKEVDLSTQRLGDKSLKGIYKVEGEKLFFCYAYDPKLARPKDFKIEAGDNCYLYELKKVGN